MATTTLFSDLWTFILEVMISTGSDVSMCLLSVRQEEDEEEEGGGVCLLCARPTPTPCDQTPRNKLQSVSVATRWRHMTCSGSERRGQMMPISYANVSSCNKQVVIIV